GTIDNIIPGTLNLIENTRSFNSLNALKNVEKNLYEVVIPQGMMLDKSRDMKGAYRATFRKMPNRYAGQANLKPVTEYTDAVNKIKTVNGINSLMGLASLVVGQYYISQINSQLKSISKSINAIMKFQENEYYAKVYALLQAVYEDIRSLPRYMENVEERNRKLISLDSVGYQCDVLLVQANKILDDISVQNPSNYKTYKKMVGEAEKWFQYEIALIDCERRICDLKYVLNMGNLSRKDSNIHFIDERKRVVGTLDNLSEWHMRNAEKFGILDDVEKRKRKGIPGAARGVVGMINANLKYESIPNNISSMIKNQLDYKNLKEPVDEKDLYQSDIKLVVREGRLYYSPV
ncbi:MAG: hypothetical protein ACI4UK_05135, partial [Floccifex sp.]